MVGCAEGKQLSELLNCLDELKGKVAFLVLGEFAFNNDGPFVLMIGVPDSQSGDRVESHLRGGGSKFQLLERRTEDMPANGGSAKDARGVK